METDAHLALKRLAVAHLLRSGCMAVATEVLCPIARFRIDVAGYQDTLPLPAEALVAGVSAPLFAGQAAQATGSRRCPPRTIIIECKQSRSDFLRDRRDMERLLSIRARLEARRVFIEERLRHEEPQLRRAGETLFPECDAWDFERSRRPSYQETLRRLERIDEQIHGETKFCRLARWRLADRMFLIAPRGMIRPGEVPPGWGLLECPRRMIERPDSIPERLGELAEDAVRVRIEPPERWTPEKRRVRLLRNIAVAATRNALRAQSAERRPTTA